MFSAITKKKEKSLKNFSARKKRKIAKFLVQKQKRKEKSLQNFSARTKKEKSFEKFLVHEQKKEKSLQNV